MYVGQTINSIEKRWDQHNRGNYCRLLHYAINKYGKENFTIEVLCECDSYEDMDEKEKYFILALNTLKPNGYNLMTGGAAPRHSEETRKKMSMSRKGKAQTGKAAKGYPRPPKSPETCRKISESKKGVPCYKLRGYKRGYKPIPKKYVKVWAMSFLDRKIEQFESIQSASEFLGFTNKKSHGNIVAVLNGRRRIAYDYYWSYDPIPENFELPIAPPNPRRKTILQLDKKTGEVIREWDCIMQARDFFKNNNINTVLTGGRKTAAGFGWKYK